MSHLHLHPIAAPEALPKDDGPRSGFRLPAFRATSLKPLTYSAMHLCVAVTVAYVLTRDWRIALGVGVIEPMVQTVAYMLHEKAWSARGF